jgi:hypothetical protein
MNYYKKWIIGLALLAIVAAGSTAYYMYNKPHADVAKMEVKHTLEASTLYESFESNEQKANKEYLNDVIKISGKLMQIEEKENENTTLILDAGGLMGGVKCELDTHSGHDLSKIEVGDQLSLKGICTGYLMDVILVRCIIIPNS